LLAERYNKLQGRGGNATLDWFSETMLKIVTSVPALFAAEEFPYFYGRSSDVWIDPDRARRVIAMRPFRSAIARYMGKVSNLFVRKR
jgi:hypothetical protein